MPINQDDDFNGGVIHAGYVNSYISAWSRTIELAVRCGVEAGPAKAGIGLAKKDMPEQEHASSFTPEAEPCLTHHPFITVP